VVPRNLAKDPNAFGRCVSCVTMMKSELPKGVSKGMGGWSVNSMAKQRRLIQGKCRDICPRDSLVVKSALSGVEFNCD
jgi:hypothetical protein